MNIPEFFEKFKERSNPNGFKELGFDTVKSESPIIPLFIREL